MKYVIAGVIFAVALLILFKTGEDRPRCNAIGDVRYVGKHRYECEQTKGNGLRWTLKP